MQTQETRDDPIYDYIEMDDLFQQQGRAGEEDSTERDTGTASHGPANLVDYNVTPTDEPGRIRVQLIFMLVGSEKGDFASYTTTYCQADPDAFLETLLNRNKTDSLADLLGTTVTVAQQNDNATKWEVTEHDATLAENIYGESFDPKRNLAMDRQFQHIRHADARQTCGPARLIDFYVRESAAGITQDLEVGLKFELPDGTTAWYECIHDVAHPDNGLTRVLKYFDNPENLFDIENEELPVEYNAEEQTWYMYVPNGGLERLTAYVTRKRPHTPHGKEYIVPIEKTYSHGKPQHRRPPEQSIP